MELRELLEQAWAAVEAAGIPSHLHEVAFREAVAELRADKGPGDAAHAATQARKASTTRKAKPGETADSNEGGVAEDDFFTRLAQEAGVNEDELREILHLTENGTVQVDRPTRDLGKTKAEQARTVVALVAGARHGGIGESPVSAQAVRAECQRKNCYDQPNFAAKHIGAMKGFILSGTDIRLKPKWVEEFDQAVGRVVGRPESE